MGPAVGAGFGPGAFLPKQEPGADPGRRCRREEEGGDGKPVSGRLRQALTASSPETAANSAVELPGPRQATGTRPYPVSRTGAVGRRRARVGAGGGSRGCENVPRPPFSSREPWGLGRGRRCKSGADNCEGSEWRSTEVNVGIGILRVEFPKGRGFKDIRRVAVVDVNVFVHSSYLTPIFSFPFVFVFYCKGMTSQHLRENRVQAQKLFPHHHLLKN